MSFRTLDEADLAGKRALVRVDFNVPMEGGRVTDDTRLRAALPTIEKLRKGGAKVVLLAHFDRPKGKRVPEMSLQPVVEPLARLVGAPVAFADDCIGDAAKAAIDALPPRGVVLLENVRYHAGEEKNDPEFAKALAAGGDLYVNDAFSAAHRAHASTEGLARLLPAYAGEQMRRELEALEMALGSPKRPVMGIVGGAKVSTKLDLLNNLVGKLQYLAIGGGMANTFRYAQGYEIGGSLCEKEMADTARQILDKAKAAGCHIILPTDAVVAEQLASDAATRTVELSEPGAMGPQDKIFDVGPKTLAQILDAISEAATLVWNGPLGVFEVQPFDRATVEAAQHAARLAKSGKLVAVAGGGDTVAALNAAGVSGDFTFVSTAGGAFLEWMEGKTLPGVAALSK
ncbi:phosphoglycerate kinase [Phenylobacterium terrae]|uniref:Phosphoglycerate kinase n=1 Tax=Phenylobacterium terrae TaxID=2665495 RepID=A0ABW4N226_9CAUL